MSKAYENARRELGTWEWKDGHNPKIVQWFADVGHDWVKDDETAWCAAFVGAMLKSAGIPHTGALNARSYQDWGRPVDLKDARPGDVVVFSRGDPAGWQGHVGFFVREVGGNIVVLGGNQANQVNERAYSKDRLLAVRRHAAPAKTSAAQSTTVWATAGQVGGAAVTGGTAISALSGTAQIVALVGVLVIVLAAMWILRERIRKIAEGMA